MYELNEILKSTPEEGTVKLFRISKTNLKI